MVDIEKAWRVERFKVACSAMEVVMDPLISQKLFFIGTSKSFISTCRSEVSRREKYETWAGANLKKKESRYDKRR
jgi:hypothetical protein